MTKLPEKDQFWDLSNYGGIPATWIVTALMPTSVGALTLTWAFTAVGFLSAFLIWHEQNLILAAALLPIKSMLDATDGQMARRRNRPSYVGRYLDSISDFLINLAILASITVYTKSSWSLCFISFICMEIQGSLYNYYYVIKRHQGKGDKTSRVLETSAPEPYPWDHPLALSVLHTLYLILYGWLDILMHWLDPNATQCKNLPKPFLTLVSTFGLGFQLLVMALLLAANKPVWIYYYFLIPSNILAVLIILIRRKWLK